MGYFFVVAGGVTLYAHPGCRAAIHRALHHLPHLLRSALHRVGPGALGGLRAMRRRLLGGTRTTLQELRRQRLLFGGALCLLAVPPLLALSLGSDRLFEYADDLRAPDRRIAVLLAGERLVPPTTLPPEVFTTREVELALPQAPGASRDWDDLEPDFRQRLLLVFKLMRERHGYEMVLIEGYRSPGRQALLAARGRHTTLAGPYMSYHQYGLAADSAFYRDGKLVIAATDAWTQRGYALYGELAEAAGLHWGGRWQMRDLGHVELRRPETLGTPINLASH